MGLTLITAPERLVSLADLKRHLRVDHDDDDWLLNVYLDAATAHVDGKYGILQVALRPQTWEYTLDGFPDDAIDIPLPPLISIESVKYLDSAGVEQTIDEVNYVADVGGLGRIVLSDGYSWPSTLTAANAVRIRFVAGYEEGVDEEEVPIGVTVPPPIMAAVMLMVADWYEHRETVGASVSEIPMTAPAMALLKPYRQMLV